MTNQNEPNHFLLICGGVAALVMLVGGLLGGAVLAILDLLK